MCCVFCPNCCLQLKSQILKPKLGSSVADNVVVGLCLHFCGAMGEHCRV